MVKGWRGTRSSGARTAGASMAHRRAVHPTVRDQAGPSTTETGDGGLEERWKTPARPSSSGCTSGDLGVDELQPVALEVGLREERRDRGERVDGRADVVAEARQRELRGAGSAADRVGGLQHQHGAARPPRR